MPDNYYDYKPPDRNEAAPRLAENKQADEGTVMLRCGEKSAGPLSIAVARENATSESKSSGKRSRPDSQTSPRDPAVRTIETRRSESRKLLEVSRYLLALEDSNSQAHARKLMLEDHDFSAKGKMALVEGFQEEAEVCGGVWRYQR